jgi:hypothetical protein
MPGSALKRCNVKLDTDIRISASDHRNRNTSHEVMKKIRLFCFTIGLS